MCVSYLETFQYGSSPWHRHPPRAALQRQMDNDTSGRHPPRDEFEIDSQFIFYLLKDWAWGGWSASEAQQRAMHAYNDQCSRMQTMGVNPNWCRQAMLKMSGMGNARGSSNIQKGDIHKDLMKCLGHPSIHEPYMVQVPMVLSSLEQLKCSKTMWHVPSCCHMNCWHIITKSTTALSAISTWAQMNQLVMPGVHWKSVGHQ